MKPFALALIMIFAMTPAAFADAPDREPVNLTEHQTERAAQPATVAPQGRTFWGQMLDAWKVRNGFVPSYAEVAPGVPHHGYVSSTPVQGNAGRVDLGVGQTITPNAYGPGVHMNHVWTARAGGSRIRWASGHWPAEHHAERVWPWCSHEPVWPAGQDGPSMVDLSVCPFCETAVGFDYCIARGSVLIDAEEEVS